MLKSYADTLDAGMDTHYVSTIATLLSGTGASSTFVFRNTNLSTYIDILSIIW